MNTNDFNNQNSSNSGFENITPSSRRRNVTNRKERRWLVPVAIVLGAFGLFFILIFASIGIFVKSLESLGTGFTETQPVEITENTILKLDFSDLSEVSNASALSIFSSKAPKATFYQLIESIQKAAEDPRIIGIYYDGGNGVSGAMASELQVALENFKKSNKFIYSYLETATKGDYAIAANSDSIFVPDEGMYELSGFGITSLFNKGLYDKIGLEFIVVQCEDFKSAAEPYKNKKFSDSARFEYKILIQQKENEFVNTISTKRKISAEQVIEAMKKGLLDANDMLELKLADAKASKLKVLEFLSQKSKNNSNKFEDIDKKIVSINNYVLDNKKNKQEKNSNATIAVICGEGPIVSIPEHGMFNYSETQQIVSRDFVKLIYQAKEDDDIKGIIIRINSPGGSVIASEEIYQAIIETKKVKPVYASMSDVAASGGYYMAMACDTIVAHSNTVTGSIGVVAAFPNVSKLLNNLYVNADTISNGVGNPFFLNSTLPRNAQNEAEFEKNIYKTYQRFLKKVALSRKKTVEEIRTVAKGRVWLGKDALDKGLVDAVGNLQTAITMMKNRLNVKDSVKLKFYPDEQTDKFKLFMQFIEDNDVSVLGLIDLIGNRINNNNNQRLADMLMLPQNEQKQFKYLQTLVSISKKEKVLLALPNLIEIK